MEDELALPAMRWSLSASRTPGLGGFRVDLRLRFETAQVREERFCGVGDVDHGEAADQDVDRPGDDDETDRDREHGRDGAIFSHRFADRFGGLVGGHLRGVHRGVQRFRGGHGHVAFLRRHARFRDIGGHAEIAGHFPRFTDRARYFADGRHGLPCGNRSFDFHLLADAAQIGDARRAFAANKHIR